MELSLNVSSWWPTLPIWTKPLEYETSNMNSNKQRFRPPILILIMNYPVLAVQHKKESSVAHSHLHYSSSPSLSSSPLSSSLSSVNTIGSRSSRSRPCVTISYRIPLPSFLHTAWLIQQQKHQHPIRTPSARHQPQARR